MKKTLVMILMSLSILVNHIGCTKSATPPADTKGIAAAVTQTAVQKVQEVARKEN